jgi:hypothetical protein
VGVGWYLVLSGRLDHELGLIDCAGGFQRSSAVEFGYVCWDLSAGCYQIAAEFLGSQKENELSAVLSLVATLAVVVHAIAVVPEYNILALSGRTSVDEPGCDVHWL